jgi:bile acid:Na+ symporter, BASS family
MTEVVPLWLVNLLAFITVFSVMTSIGTSITPSLCLDHLRAPWPLIRGLISVLVIVPIIGIAISFAFDLDLAEKVGVALIVIAPGAPLALRRALTSGADFGFAPTLQSVLAVLAVPAVPIWVIIANAILGTRGISDVASVAKQVFLAQLLPLGLGAIVRRLAPVRGPWLGTWLGRAGAILLLVALASIILNVRYSILATHPWPIAAAAITTLAGVGLGHLIGGSSPQVRHSIAIAGAMRNVGFALLIATINRTPPTVEVVIISYAITAILLVTVYIRLWAEITGGPDISRLADQR